MRLPLLQSVQPDDEALCVEIQIGVQQRLDLVGTQGHTLLASQAEPKTEHVRPDGVVAILRLSVVSRDAYKLGDLRLERQRQPRYIRHPTEMHQVQGLWFV